MARRARDSVAPLRRSSAGWMPARIGRLSAGVGCRHPVTIRTASFMARSMRRVWALRYQKERSTLLLNGPGQEPLFAGFLLQQPSQSQQAASWVRRMMSAFCEVTRGVDDTWRPVQIYSEVFRFGADKQSFSAVVDVYITFSYLFLEVEDCRHRFCSPELQLPGLEVFTYSCHVLANHPFHCMSVSISMHGC